MFSKSLYVIVTLSLLFKDSTCDLSPHYTADSHKEQAVNEAYDYYKNLYLSYYGTDGPQSSAEVPIESQTHSESGETPSFLTDTANKIKGVFNRQDGFGEVGAPFGEVDDSLIAIAGAVLGGLAVIGVLINANNIQSLSTDQDNICTVVKDIGSASLSSITSTTSIDSDAERMAEFNKIITEINSYATPSC